MGSTKVVWLVRETTSSLLGIVFPVTITQGDDDDIEEEHDFAKFNYSKAIVDGNILDSFNNHKFKGLLSAHIHSFKNIRDHKIFVRFTGVKDGDRLSIRVKFEEDFIQSLGTLKNLHNAGCGKELAMSKLKLVVDGNISLLIATGGSTFQMCEVAVNNVFDVDDLAEAPADLRQIKLSQFVGSIPFRNILPENPGQTIKFCIKIRLEWIQSGEAQTLLPSSKVVIRDDPFLKRLFGDESTKDFVLVAGNGGSEVKCHRMVLMTRSEVFAAMLKTRFEMKEAKSGRFTLEGIGEHGLNHFVRYLYGFEILPNDLDCQLVLDLLQNGHAYGFNELVRSVSSFVLGRSQVWFENEEDGALQMYFLAKKLESEEEFMGLVGHLLKIMNGMPIQSLRSSQTFQELSQEDQVDLLCKLLEMKGQQQQNKEEPKLFVPLSTFSFRKDCSPNGN